MGPEEDLVRRQQDLDEDQTNDVQLQSNGPLILDELQMILHGLADQRVLAIDTELHVEKARGLAGAVLDPIEARLSLDDEGRTRWSWGPVDEQDLHRVAALLRQGLNPNQVARELGISKSKAYRLREQLAQ